MAESSPSNAAASSDPDRIQEDPAPAPAPAPTTTITEPVTFEVYLNVYDASSANPLLRLLGLGWYRSSVLVHGREYTFRPESKKGRREYGIVTANEGQLRWCQGLKLRALIPIGQTQLNPTGVSGIVFGMQNEYNMVTYHPITKNSHHFADRLCREMTGSGIPAWVNRITIIWPLCKCLLPPDPEEVHRAERRNLFAPR